MATSFSPEEQLVIEILNQLPNYKHPVLLNAGELFGELHSLNFRLAHEISLFIKTGCVNDSISYRSMCFTMLKLRDCIDEIKDRGYIDSEINALWDVTEFEQ